MTQPATCTVCNEPEPPPALLSECFGCAQPYHLNPYANRPGKDCGDAWIGDDALTLQFFCQRCIDRARQQAGAAPATRSDVGPASGGSPIGAVPSALPATQPDGGFTQLLDGMQQLQGMLDARARPQAPAPGSAPAGAPPPIRQRDARARRRYRRID
ncbi:MAG: hypothetical protein EXR63_01110 [Dehalococcoidia bacterium]|nr:hypothetical protein [Dehalococcoidia bacterium]